MKLSEILKSSMSAIVKNKRRSILTMLGIIIGIAAVITIMALGKGFQKSMVANLTQSTGNEVVVNILFAPYDENLYESSLTFYGTADLELASSVEGVQKVRVGELDRGFETLTAKSYYSDGEGNSFISRTRYSGEILYGRNLDSIDEESEAAVVIISRETAVNFYKTADNAVGQTIFLQDRMFRVVGVFPGVSNMDFMSLDRSDIYIPDATFRKYFAPENSGNNLMITLKSVVSPKTVTDQVVEKLRLHGTMKNNGEYRIFDLAVVTEGIGNALQMITYFISAIAGISLLIAGVGVMNMMYISVSERTKEIGIRRALGATQGSIRNQFLFEGLLITSIGGLLGFLFGVAGASLISKFLPFQAAVDINSILLTVVISVSIGLVFSVMPANAAAKKDLIDIMR